MKKRNIVLTGFMGVGKGTLARQLIARTSAVALDTDDLIESYSGMSVKKIFKIHGEAHFRALEQRVVDWVIQGVEHTIISTGGGMPIYAERFEEMGTVVYLKADFDWIYERMRASRNAKRKFEKRPLFQDRKKAMALMESREERYESTADLILDVRELPLEALVEQILALKIF